jgi:hypothetical protein
MNITIHETDKDEYYGKSIPVDRIKISGESKEQFKKARENEDVQKQLDIIWNILTGDEL